MPELKRFLLADTAEGLTEAEILDWRVQPGDEVQVNQIVVEVETAKAAVELPIPWAGVVTELLAEPGETVEVGAPILTIDVNPTGAASSADAEPPAEEEMKPLVGYGSKAVSTRRRPRRNAVETTAGSERLNGLATTAPTPRAPVEEPAAGHHVPVDKPPVRKPVEEPAGGYVPLAKPPVRKLAKELGVDLRTVAGSAEGGVITRADVERAAAPVAAAPAGGRERRVPIKSVRKATAQAVTQSAFTAPHVTEFLTVDVTPMMELREKLKRHPDFAGVKLTPLAFAAKALCLAVKRTPEVNATWDADAGEIVFKDYVHLGIAAATPRGLVVPKIRDADAMSLLELARALDQLTTTAREGKTPPADMLNGTITITNVGVFGVDTGTPIINPGESAILAFGTIRDTPWVVDGQIQVRKVLQLALSFDHRLVDGQQGSEFLADVGALLADPGLALTY
ncbi:dihydrolipoamide acetyltransferase family protein [Amycolatopsis taiwanensis]|uniref:dihydrolipoamide acetyltransferase family protein n=1 Tax=Amycolatopsis taiwanensis TaxID=342230 RepID=UPI00047F9917|nr:dihydrolipoamide acetyltransferase family protein [Amycolatopsis taiwanensis]